MADSSNHIYYYLYNLQGDVIALADSNTGKLVATYAYDAWGKCTVTNATGFNIGTENPFRYRGYYYDSESQLYYLQSRYYDAETGRFINADAFATTDITTPLSANMFAYCENNPVMRYDPTGEIYHIVAGAVIGAVINMGAQIIANGISGAPLDENLGVAMVTGAVSGAFAASGVGAVGQGVVGAATSLASYVTTTPKEEFNAVECVGETVLGFASAYSSGPGFASTKKVASQVNVINQNLHAVKKSKGAARNCYSALSRIAYDIHDTVKSAISDGIFSGVRQGFTSKIKQWFGR